MAAVTRLQILRGTSAQRLSFIPLKGELVHDTDTNFLYIGDGITPGGVLSVPLAAATDKIILPVRNETGSTIPVGTPVYISGFSVDIVLVAPARADDPAKIIVAGVTETSISNNSTGTCIVSGTVVGVDLSSFTVDKHIYLGPSGGFVDAKPVEPNYIVSIGTVEIASVSGRLLVHLNDAVDIPNFPANHIPIGQAGGNTTTVDADAKIAANAAVVAATTHIAQTNNPHAVTKAQVGLGNVDNTSDLDKPISTATQAALNLKYDASNPNGYETPTQLNARDTANRARANHTGTQLAATISDFASTVLSTVLAGFTVGANAAIAATDTILQAFQKVQGQINARALSARQILAGYGLTGGGDLTADRTLAVNLSATEDKLSTPFVTSSVTDVLITGMSRTPAAGRYLLLFNAFGTFDSNNRISTNSVYVGGVKVADTERPNQHLDQTRAEQLSNQAMIDVNGSQLVEIRVRVNAAQLTVNQRSMILLRVS